MMSKTRRWQPGEIVVRREVLHGEPWLDMPVHVVEDSPELLAVYMAEGSELLFPTVPADFFEHPWKTRGHTVWNGHGKLMLHRPGDAYSIDLFWHGPGRRFDTWYINLQAPLVRLPRGFITLDHELDLLVSAEGAVTIKDDDLLDERVREGRYTRSEVERFRALGARLASDFAGNGVWADPAWMTWTPPADFRAATVPDGWDRA